MIKNFFIIAWRNLARNKTFSLINILGLGLGIATSLLIYLWVQDERGKDNFHANSERLFQVIVSDRDKNGGVSGSYDNTPGLLAEALKKQIPEISATATVLWEQPYLFKVGDKIGKEKGRYVGAEFLEMFTFPLVGGNKTTALASPDNIVISQQLAEKYFDGKDPIGKVIRVDNKRDYIVSGIMAPMPGNSTLSFNFLLPIQHGFEDSHWMIDGWNHFGPATYVLLRKDASPAAVNAKLKEFLVKQDKVLDDKMLSLQLFRDRYLYSDFTNGIPSGGRIDYVRLFTLIAIFILLIACINFMNLATARSAKRSKEVGVRKVAGAGKGLLFRQFVFEAIMTTFIAVAVAIGLVYLLLPYFNQLTGKEVSLTFKDPQMILMLGILAVLTGFVAGSYPALFLSSLKPIAVLKGTLKFKNAGQLFRKGLVVFQFSLSILLIVCTIVVYRQMHYVQNKNLGLDHSQLIYLPVEGNLVNNFENFKRDALASGNIENLSFCGTDPTNVGWWSPSMQWEGKDPNDKTLFAQIEVYHDFLKTVKVGLVEGRDFSLEMPTDSSNFLVNESAVKYMKLQHPVGATFSHGGVKGKIIGVIKDYNFRSLRFPVAPAFINLAPSPENGVALIRSLPGKTAQTLSSIEAISKKYNPEYPFEYSFADEALNRQYRSDMIVGQLAAVFACLAIFISCMGLFGLSMFMAEQRTREIGIRKAIGASVMGIVAMLSRNFLLLVAISFIIASPIAWWTMKNWLQEFAYRTPIDWTIFFITALLAMGIALFTVSFQAIKAALASPVRSLRSE
jgi:predicted permease